MVRRRHAVNPAKVKLDAGALDSNPPPEVFQRRLELRRRLTVALLCLLSVVLLTTSFTPYDCWYLAYVALVPLGLAMGSSGSGRWPVVCAALSGVVFWAVNLYWLWWITLVGYAALVVYLSVYWLAGAVLVRWAMARRVPTWIAMPVVWVSLEYARAYVISGFPWFYLAHSQYTRTRLIQIADMTGQYGVSFFVAAVNGALIDLFSAPLFVRTKQGPRLGIQIISGLAFVAAMTAGLMTYGTYRLNEHTTEEGPVIGIVQQSFPIALGRASAGAEETLRRHAEPARKLKDAGCDLVIWPETMLPTGLNVEAAGADIAALSPEDARDLALKLMGPRACDVYYEAVREGPLPGAAGGREDDARTRGYKLALLHHLRQGHALGSGGREPPLKDYLAEMESLTRLIGCPILAGGGTLHRNPSPLDKDDRWVQRNSALWFDPDANSAGDALPSDRQRYSKVHLVPFSEYVPFKDGWPWFHRLLRWFVPAEMPQLAAGEEYRLMELRRRVRPSPATTEKAEGDRAARTWRIAAPICYEGTFDYECRRMVYQDGRKAADILANLSNDGWFVWKWWPERGSNEHSQHLVQYCFRAVENRVPVVRAVNTGISASVDSDGRIRAVVEQYGVRTAVGGVLVLDGAVASDGLPLPGHGPRVLVDGRVSVYSRVGDVFAVMVSLAAAALAGWMVWKRRQSKEGARK